MGIETGAGYALGLEGREVTIRAIDQALADLGETREPIAFAFIVASNKFDIQGVLNGATAQLGASVVFGFSSPGQLTQDGIRAQSVAALLVAGRDVQALTAWDAGPGSNLFKGLQAQAQAPKGLLVLAGGMLDRQEQITDWLSHTDQTPAAGGLTSPGGSGNYLFSGEGNGREGVAAALLCGGLSFGVGADHGWLPVGLYFREARMKGRTLTAVDGESPSEFYARIFGQPAAEWSRPPLQELVRLYPLGMETGNGSLVVRSPLHIESGGSFQMTSPLPAGQPGHLLVGSASECIKAARRAAHAARENLGGADPKAALVFVDQAWAQLGEIQPFDIVQAVREVLGEEVRIAGGFTVGQFVAGKQTGPDPGPILNQHIEIVLLGD